MIDKFLSGKRRKNTMITRDNILKLEIRRKIYDFIDKNPGLNISEISRKMNITRSALRHHLKYLMRLNLIIVKIDMKNKRLYACGQLGTKDQKLLSLLRQGTTFKIIMHLFYPGFCSRDEIAKDLNLRPSTIYFHIKKLLDLDVIKVIEVRDGKFIASYYKSKPFIFKKPIGTEKFYMWKNSEIMIDVYRLLITHKDSMAEPSIIDAYEDFCEEWNQMWKSGRPKNIFNANSAIDNLIDMLDEIFPFPYRL